jgi:hypothetical protein
MKMADDMGWHGNLTYYTMINQIVIVFLFIIFFLSAMLTYS